MVGMGRHVKLTTGQQGTVKRLLFSAVIVRTDWATGEEGYQFQILISHARSMFSVDSPG